MAEGNYLFAGIDQVEAQDRINEHRTGVPGAGAGMAGLLAAPISRTACVKAVNTGEHAVEVRLRHGSSVKSVAAELLKALDTGALTTYRGNLQWGRIVPGTVVVTDPGANPLLVDTNGDGILYETGTTVQRGTIDYVSGAIDFTYGAAATAPVTIAYDHTSPTDFASPGQVTNQAAAGAFPEVMPLGFGRVVPGSVAVTHGGVTTYADDGKGNMIETTGGSEAVQGSIDYATGVITFTGGSAVLAGTIAVTYTFNPFAALLVGGGGTGTTVLYPGQIPELSDEPWADGAKGEDEVWMVGTGRTTHGGHLVTQWTHWGEEPYRVRQVFSAFPPGGHSNDPRV
jgi:hypothetical protein